MAELDAANIWASGEAYEAYVGRWSRPVASEFVKWLSAPPDSVWLDVGCGTGALARTILEMASPRCVIGVDHSAAFVDYLRSQLASRQFCGAVQDASNLALAQETCNLVVSGLAINFVPEPQQAVRKEGGCVAAYIWDYGEMQLMRYFWNSACQLDPAARELDESVRFRMWKPEGLSNLFESAGLENVETRTINVPTLFRDFEDYWLPFLGGQGPAPAYAASLSEERRSALREQVRANLPMAADGSIHLNARAGAVRGTR
jgi:SAM-dependent methyltransferase